MKDLIKGEFEWHEKVNANFHELSNGKTNIEDLLESTGYGVISGLMVSAKSSMSVNVDSGIVYMPNGVRLEITGNNDLAINIADAVNPRIDVVYINNDGTIGYTVGIPADLPVIPGIPTGAFLLAQINVAAKVMSITNTNIIDMRKIKNTTESLAKEIKKNGDDFLSYKTENTQNVADLKNYTVLKSNKDSVGICTTVMLKRVDGTLFMKSVLSGGSSPKYSNRTETYYKADGKTVDIVINYTRTYDSDGILLSEVIV